MNKDKKFLFGLLDSMFYARIDGDSKLILICLGVVRGYVHALRRFGIITPSCCYRLCSLPLDEMSKEKAFREVSSCFDAGFDGVRDGCFNATDYALNVVENMEDYDEWR